MRTRRLTQVFCSEFPCHPIIALRYLRPESVRKILSHALRALPANLIISFHVGFKFINHYSIAQMFPLTMSITIDNSHFSLPQAGDDEDPASMSKSTFAFGFNTETHSQCNHYDDSDEFKTASTASITSFCDSDEFACSISTSSNNNNSCDQEVSQTSKNTPLQDSASVAVSVTTATKANNSTSGKKHVRFGSLTIHEHTIEMGGPGVPVRGPAITLGWKEECCMKIASVESYEDSRTSLQRKSSQMLQPQAQRVDLLLEAGYSMNQIRSCTLECEQIRKQRSRTVKRVTFKHRTKSAMKRLLSR